MIAEPSSANPVAKVVRFTVAGKPTAKGRPVASARYGRTRVFTPKQTVDYEATVAAAASAAMLATVVHLGPVEVEMIVVLEPSQWVSKATRSKMLSGDQKPTKRPDLDNVVKAVIDGCCGVAFEDDCQVIAISARKVYGPTGQVDVSLRFLTS